MATPLRQRIAGLAKENVRGWPGKNSKNSAKLSSTKQANGKAKAAIGGSQGDRDKQAAIGEDAKEDSATQPK